MKGHIIYVDIYYICSSPFYEEDSERDGNLSIAECAKCGEYCHKMFKNPLSYFHKYKCRVKMYEMLEHNIKIEKEKKDFIFFQLKLI